VTFKPGDKVRLLSCTGITMEELDDRGPFAYSWNTGKTATILRQHSTSPAENGQLVWEVEVENSEHKNYHGTFCDFCSEAAMELIESPKKITVWPLELTTDQAKDLIVWLMTDHDIHAVERDTPDGDVFVMEDDEVDMPWGS
jgi:hypothetical protein